MCEPTPAKMRSAQSGGWRSKGAMRASNGAGMRRPPRARFSRRTRGAPPFHLRATLLALCLLAVVACGRLPTSNRASSTPTATASFVPAAVVGSVRSLRMFDATTGWAATTDRLLRTTDGALHWRDVTPPLPPAPSHPLLGAFPLSVDNAWVVRGQTGSGPGASQSTLSHTTDGGQTWRTSAAPVFAVAQITFVDAEHGWMLADLDTADGEQGADILRTTDGGQTWAKVASAANRPGALPLMGQKFGLTFHDARTGWVVQGDALDPAPRLHGLFQTHDGGSTWQPAPALAWPAALAHDPSLDEVGRLPTFFSPQMGVLPVLVVAQATGDVTATVLYVSHDGGASWSPTAPLTASIGATSFDDALSLLDASTWWIASSAHGDTTLFQTADGGQRWASWTPGAPFAAVSALDFVSGAQGWAIGSVGLLRTSDGGHTWTILAAAPSAG